jgi:hypothetical protein
VGLMLASGETNRPDHNHWKWRWPNTTGHKLAPRVNRRYHDWC